MAAYYNEFKPEAAHMLRQLIANGLMAPGDVDERPIQDVRPDDLRGYTQCHFFAGIGGWSVALRTAMWPDDRPVWTGSCPCQPFSTAGKQKGKADERHLWPVWFRLIRECAPTIVFGEQVASAIAHGWWDDVATDMEAEGYSCGAAVLPACSVGKPHKRDRLWFVADRDGGRFNTASIDQEHSQEHNIKSCSTLADAGSGRRGEQNQGKVQQSWGAEAFSASYVANTSHVIGHERGCSDNSGAGRRHEGQIRADSGFLDVADTKCGGRQGPWALGEPEHPAPSSDGQTDQPFDDSSRIEWIACPDGKQRPVEPSICLLAHGVQHRAPILHAFGNAIVPQVASAFIEAARGCIDE